MTYSAVIYCLRCLLPDIMDIPLNQGCLQPITILLPNQSLLHPSSTAAVVGGNVLTSQRVTDVILRAFEACAASQGCMNNLTFGDGTMGYYETIAGGSGAGPGYHGVSGVHTHMTNTRITDPEILERRYPVVLRWYVYTFIYLFFFIFLKLLLVLVFVTIQVEMDNIEVVMVLFEN